MDRLKHLPILGFILRYWPLLLFCFAGVTGCLADTVFARFGTLAYVVGVPCIPVVLALFFRHLFFRETLDRYIAQGSFTEEFWFGLTPWARHLLALGYFAVLAFSAAYVAGAMGK